MLSNPHLLRVQKDFSLKEIYRNDIVSESINCSLHSIPHPSKTGLNRVELWNEIFKGGVILAGRREKKLRKKENYIDAYHHNIGYYGIKDAERYNRTFVSIIEHVWNQEYVILIDPYSDIQSFKYFYHNLKSYNIEKAMSNEWLVSSLKTHNATKHLLKIDKINTIPLKDIVEDTLGTISKILTNVENKDEIKKMNDAYRKRYAHSEHDDNANFIYECFLKSI